MKFRPLFFLFMVAISATSCSTTHYYLVRHAERLDGSADSPLSPAGHTRAIALKDVLLGKNIDTILVSNRLRTQQTAQPLAEALQIRPTIYSPDTTAGLTQALRLIAGKKVLVVGHSNTIPEIVAGLSGQTVQIADNDFDNLFIVSKRRFMGQISIRFEHHTYGAPSP